MDETDAVAARQRRSSRLVSPPREELTRLRTPFEPGEQQLFELLDALLAPEWEIYIQPHLNGLRPDFVVLNPTVGIGIFEVKDWRTFEYEDPSKLAAKIRHYHDEMLQLYCPSIASRMVQNSSAAAVVTATLVMTNMPTGHVCELTGLTKTTLRAIGCDVLASRDLKRIYPDGARTNSHYMAAEMARDLRSWLGEPVCSAVQRQPLLPELDPRQRSLVYEDGPMLRRVRGAAGSGKSVVLASRAARLALEGKRGLVVTSNITLLHYLRDLAVRFAPDKRARAINDQLTWLHFHAWCKRVCLDAGYDEEYSALWSGDGDHSHVLDDALATLTAKAALELEEKFDFIFVDEGQDFRLSWWNALRQMTDGEMLLVADHGQDLFGNAAQWTEESMKGAGFRGPWNQLKTGYRSPVRLQELLTTFQDDFLSGEINKAEPPPDQMELIPPRLEWIQTRDECLTGSAAEAVTELHGNRVHPADVVVLAQTITDGEAVVKTLGYLGYKVVHTFNVDDQKARRLKQGFYSGDARIKATTIHSYRGFESPRMVVIIRHMHAGPQGRSAIYVALSRLRRDPRGSSMTVVCTDDQLLAYGQKWPSFRDERMMAPNTSHQAARDDKSKAEVRVQKTGGRVTASS